MGVRWIFCPMGRGFQFWLTFTIFLATSAFFRAPTLVVQRLEKPFCGQGLSSVKGVLHYMGGGQVQGGLGLGNRVGEELHYTRGVILKVSEGKTFPTAYMGQKMMGMIPILLSLEGN